MPVPGIARAVIQNLKINHECVPYSGTPTNHTNKLRVILTIAALFINIIILFFVFVRVVSEVRG
jgi:hypothetical protein